MMNFIRQLIFSIFFFVIITGTIFAQTLSLKNFESGNHMKGIGESFFDNTNVSYKAGYLEETEELYSNTSIYQKISAGKSFSYLFRLDVLNQIEYSRRVQVDVPDRERWFDNTKLVASFDPNDFNHIEAFGSASISDTTITSYGGKYRAIVEFGDFILENTLEGGYDYFYYWNMVGQDYISETVDLSYWEMSLGLSYFYGNVRDNYIEGYDIKGRNPNDMFNAGLSMDVLHNPRVNVGVYYQMRNYEHYSPLYYSPQERRIYGTGAFLFETYGRFYTYLGAGAKLDNNETFVWSADAEFGYEYNGFSASVGAGKYDDPFYSNVNVFLNLTKKF